MRLQAFGAARNTPKPYKPYSLSLLQQSDCIGCFNEARRLVILCRGYPG